MLHFLEVVLYVLDVGLLDGDAHHEVPLLDFRHGAAEGDDF